MAQNQRLDRNGYLIWMAEPQINFGVIIPWTMFAFTESSIVHQLCTVVGEKNSDSLIRSILGLPTD